MSASQTEIIVRRDGAEVLRKTVGPGEYVLGRAADCDFPVQGELVSRHHARLTISDGHLLVQDLGSSNGTFIEGQAITAPTPLAPAQKVQIGTVTIEYRHFVPERNGDAAAPSPVVRKEKPFSVPAPRSASRATPFSPLPIRPSDPNAPGLDEAEVIRRNLPLQERQAQHLDVEKEIARGGMGVIFSARESATRRTVAMKIMYEQRDADTAARFIEEAQVTAQLEHPNIVPIYDLGVDAAGQPFYTMKLVLGITLKKILELIGKGVTETMSKYSLGNLLIIFQKICDALAFAHSKGVIHRDLKPANIMLGKYGEVMVMDWGLAKIIGKKKAAAASGLRPVANLEHTVTGARASFAESFATMAGAIMGTPQYMSPEQASGEIDNLDARSDVFTLGVILYEMITLELPFPGKTPGEVVAAVEAGHFVPPATRVANRPAKERPRHLPDGKVPPSLDAIVRKAMARDPAQRYQGVPELQADLIAYQTGFATTAEKAGFGTQVILLLKRNRGIFATSAAAWIILTALLAWFVVKVTQERNVAEHALAVLKSTGPALIAQAQTLVEQQNLEEAISKVDLALQTEPRNPEYHLLRAQLLQASLRLSEAATEFRHVLEFGPNASAKANLELCNTILQSAPPDQPPSSAALHLLVEKLNGEGRIAQAVQLATRIGASAKAVDGLVKNRLEAWSKLINFDKVKSDRITNYGKNVNASSLPLKDLDWLQGLPVEVLNLDHTLISDLSPLKGLPIKELRLTGTPVADLSPLRGMPLHLLSLTECKDITDFSPVDGLPLDTFEASNSSIQDLSFLQKSPIKSLIVTGTAIHSLAFLAGKACTRLTLLNCRELADISALRGMPLRELSLDNCASVADVAVVATCADLEKLYLPRGARNIDALQSLKKVRSIGYSSSDVKTPEEFWAQRFPDDEKWKPKVALLQQGHQALIACGIAHPEPWRVKLLEDDTLDIMATTADVKTLEPLIGLPVAVLDLKGSSITDFRSLARLTNLRRLRLDYLPVKDLAPLASCKKLELLFAGYTQVTDLTPLHDLPLMALDLTSTHIRDLSPLAGMPLRVLHVEHNTLAGAQPLLSCASLEWLGINRDAPHLSDLRKLPKLSRISSDWTSLDKPDLDPYYAQPQKTAAEYWAEFDGAKTSSSPAK